MELDHWSRFAEFCHWEQKVGGPDPQIAMVAELGKHMDPWWWAGTYAAVYNVAGAHVLATNWPQRRVLVQGDRLEGWLREHWDGIPIRKERRAVRTPAKLSRQLRDYASWSLGLSDRHWMKEGRYPTTMDAYLAAWKDVTQVYGIGRYVAIKWLEMAERHLDAPIHLRDIRPRGGWSPRQALAVLWPEQREVCYSTEPASDQMVNMIAETTLQRLAIDHGTHVSHFGLQVMLCEYRESYESRRQYPGRSHDSEMKYIRQVESFWGQQPELWTTRRKLFPIEALGEFGGWDGPREECMNLLADQGVTWSDLLYDYGKSFPGLARRH